LPRFEQELQRRADEQKLARILLEVGEDEPDAVTDSGHLTRAQHHDPTRMRGIPIVGRSGYGGAIPGTSPLGALLAKERRRRHESGRGSAGRKLRRLRR
jgi:hypothetical protein